MKYKLCRGNEIEGALDIFIAPNDDEDNGYSAARHEVLIHGNPEGLRSFAKLLLELADLDQEKVADKYLPAGGREHYHLRPGVELSGSSVNVTVGRLDAKGTGEFYGRFVCKTNSAI